MQCIIHPSLSLSVVCSYPSFQVSPVSKVSYDSPRYKLTPERAIPLIKWFEEHKEHPYPSRHEKMVLCQSTQLTFTQVCKSWDLHANTFSIILYIRIVCVHLLHELLLFTYFYYSGRPLMIPCPLYCRCPRGLLMPGGGWRRQHRMRRRWRKRMALMINWRQ